MMIAMKDVCFGKICSQRKGKEKQLSSLPAS
jgi:hypothetical protein